MQRLLEAIRVRIRKLKGPAETPGKAPSETDGSGAERDGVILINAMRADRLARINDYATPDRSSRPMKARMNP